MSRLIGGGPGREHPARLNITTTPITPQRAGLFHQFFELIPWPVSPRRRTVRYAQSIDFVPYVLTDCSHKHYLELVRTAQRLVEPRTVPLGRFRLASLPSNSYDCKSSYRRDGRAPIQTRFRSSSTRKFWPS